MANNYTTHTAEESVPCSAEDLAALRALLAQTDEEDDGDGPHGMAIDGETEAYLYCDDESSNASALPERFLKKFGEVLTKAGKPWLEIGYAHTCDKASPGSHGGGSCRIYPDGTLVYPKIVWPGQEAA